MIRRATLSDVLHVGQNLWKRGRDELMYLGVHPDEWLAAWSYRIAKGDAVAFGPHAILGVDRESNSTDCTAFQAATSFEEPGVGMAVTKAMRRHIPELMRERAISQVATYSLCVDPEAPKWFRLLGLIEDTDFQGRTCGPYTMRRFIRAATTL